MEGEIDGRAGRQVDSVGDTIAAMIVTFERSDMKTQKSVLTLVVALGLWLGPVFGCKTSTQRTREATGGSTISAEESVWGRWSCRSPSWRTAFFSEQKGGSHGYHLAATNA